MTAEVQVPLQTDEQCAVARRRAIVRARAGAQHLDVVESALDRDFARDRFGERAAAGVARAHEHDLHAVTRLRSDWERFREACWPGSRRGESPAADDQCSPVPSMAWTA